MLSSPLPLLRLCLPWLLVGMLLMSPTALANRQTILVFGDSISAGYGMQAGESWPSLLADRLTLTPGFAGYRVINASVSGETTGGGLIRLEAALEAHEPALLILELGGNDGLRGYPIDRIENNLAAMIRIARDRDIRVLLVGMVLPPNYGKRYTTAFQALYQRLAISGEVDFIPVLLEGLVTPKSLMQRDGIHPTAEAQPLLLDNLWPYISAAL